MASSYQYKEVANLLDAVNQLMTHFQKYTHISKIQTIKSRVDTLKNNLRIHVHTAFREIGQVQTDVHFKIFLLWHDDSLQPYICCALIYTC